MINIEEVEQIHSSLINAFGGSYGVRDNEALQSAIIRAFQTFDNNELYPTILEKAAALLESILINHPFVDGNKRSGYSILRLFLLRHEHDITASADSKYEFIISVASGEVKYDGILRWLKANTQEV